MLSRLVILVLLAGVPVGLASSAPDPGDGTANVYRVDIQSRSEAEIVSRLGVNAFLRLRTGYLIQAPPDVEDKLARSGISFALIARNVVRGHLALDMRRDRKNAERFPVIFDDGNIRLFHIDPSDRDRSQDWQGLAPVLSDNLEIIYREPPRLDLTKKRDMLDLDSLVSQILVDSCQSYVERLQAFQTRWSGTDSNLTSRDWLMNKFIDMGYDSVYYDTFWANHTYGGWDLVPAHSVIACKVGTTYPDHQIVFGAHRDSYPVESPGADDNASGCAAVLEIARILSDIDTRMTCVFALFDTEETGLFGAWNYSNRAALNGDSIVVMINLDVIGYDSGTDIVAVSNTPLGPFGQLWHDLADSLASVDLTAVMDEWVYADGLAFAMNGFNVIEVFEYELNPYMHTAHDSTAYLDFDYMTRITRASLATAYVLDETYIPAPLLQFSFPAGIPELLIPNAPTTFEITIEAYADAVMIPGSGQVHYRIDDGPDEAAPLAEIGSGLFEATLPACPCNSRVQFYVSAQEQTGGTFVSATPESPHLAATGIEMSVIAEYDFEEYAGWQVYGDANQGLWSRYPPHGYGHNAEVPIDFDGSGMCFLTGPEPDPWNYLHTDVDGGTTILRSPEIDMAGGQVLVEYARWYSNHFGFAPYSDIFEVRISNDNGLTWTVVETVGPVEQASGGWFFRRFWVNDFMEPTARMRLRFDASDLGSDSNIEAAVDAVRVVLYSCGPAVEILTTGVPDWTAGVELSLALEASGGQGNISWSDKNDDLNGTGLVLAPEGILSGVPSGPGAIMFTAVAADELGQTDEHPYSFTINPPLVVTTEALPEGTADSAYSYPLACSGGTGAVSWTDAGGGLDGTGLDLLSTGLLAGVPTDTGIFSFTAHAEDGVGATAEKSFDLHILIAYACGDADSNLAINVADAVYLINYIFKGGSSPVPLEAGDANCDETLNVADAVYLIEYIFGGGPRPCCP